MRARMRSVAECNRDIPHAPDESRVPTRPWFSRPMFEVSLGAERYGPVNSAGPLSQHKTHIPARHNTGSRVRISFGPRDEPGVNPCVGLCARLRDFSEEKFGVRDETLGFGSNPEMSRSNPRLLPRLEYGPKCLKTCRKRRQPGALTPGGARKPLCAIIPHLLTQLPEHNTPRTSKALHARDFSTRHPFQPPEIVELHEKWVGMCVVKRP
ncbi:unnamed protein product [Gemmata massiliana]|uniref:Uncharacterized protein n=1 Tax=Gemmata massiliana TaxID=1210884 RepID=A0A6P2CXH5_9BACT|nr:unnamed protein product [Gemmata massiliana]